MASDERRPAKAVAASERVVRDILKGLYEGRYVQGQRLTETDLVEQFGVSRTTVREAIKRLSAQGIVEIQRNRGARIRSIDAPGMKNILLITELIIGLAARLAAENIEREGSREQIQGALQNLIAANTGEPDYEFVRQRNRFHQTLSRVADCPEIDSILTNLQVHLVRTRLVMDPAERGRSYENITKKILEGNALKAEKAARSHVRKVIELLEKREEARRVD